MEALVRTVVNNPITTVVVLIIIIAVIVYAYQNKKGLLEKAALYAVTKAEETWGSNTGKIKFAEVYTYIQKQYPVVTFFFTEKQLTEIIENALSRLKEILASKASVEKKSESDVSEGQ